MVAEAKNFQDEWKIMETREAFWESKSWLILVLIKSDELKRRKHVHEKKKRGNETHFAPSAKLSSRERPKWRNVIKSQFPCYD